MANHVESTQHKHRHVEIVRQIGEMLESIRFGSIEIVVHDGRVVQIKRKEKLRPESACR